MDIKKRYSEIISKTKTFGVERKCVDLNMHSGAPVPDWLPGETLYEIYVRSFSNQGSFNAVKEKLEHIKKLGINLIWLTPIYPIGELGRKGSLGSPYSVKDYFNVNPEYGSNDEFRELINAAHNLDMKVIIDMVPNHVANDYNQLSLKPYLVNRNSQGEPVRKIEDWTDIIDLDYNNPGTREHILNVMRFWITEYDIDGYRCDVAGMVPDSFWDWAAPQLRKMKNDFYLLAEWESPFLHKDSFQSSYDWTLYELMKLVYKGAESVQILLDWVYVKSKLYPKNSLPLRFLENHDKPRSASLFKQEAIKPYLVFLFSIDGLPLIYNGQEIGAKKYPSLFEREPIDWQYRDDELYQLYKKLIQLRKEYPALASKEYLFPDHINKNNAAVFVKNGKDQIILLINFNNQIEEIFLADEFMQSIKNGCVILNTKENQIWQSGKLVLQPLQAVMVKIK